VTLVGGVVGKLAALCTSRSSPVPVPFQSRALALVGQWALTDLLVLELFSVQAQLCQVADTANSAATSGVQHRLPARKPKHVEPGIWTCQLTEEAVQNMVRVILHSRDFTDPGISSLIIFSPSSFPMLHKSFSWGGCETVKDLEPL